MTGLWRKIWRVVVVGVVLLVAANSSFVFAAEKLSPEKAYLNEVLKNMMDVRNMHYDIDIFAETPLGEVKTAITGEMQEKPLSLRHDINIYYRDTQNKENTMMLKQYLEETQGNLVVYLLNNEKWIKQVMPASSSLRKELSAAEKEAARLNSLQLMKSVKLKKETPSFKYLEITLDTVQLSDAIEAAVKREYAQDKTMLEITAAGRLGLLAAGDIQYVVKVDKATKMITEISMDLTGPIRKGTGLFLDIASPKDRTTVEDFLAKSTLNVKVAYSQYNQVSPIKIPQDVRNNAKEIKPAGKAAPKKS